MSLSMYQASIPAFVQMLNNLSAILDRAEAHASSRKIDPEIPLNYRLAPDMLPFGADSIGEARLLEKTSAERALCLLGPVFPSIRGRSCRQLERAR